MRLAWLRDDASINDYFFGDGFSFHLRDLNFRHRGSLFFLMPDSKALCDPDQRAKNQNDRNCGDDDLSLFHLACNVLFIGRYRPDATSNAVCASSNCSWSLISWIRFCSKLLRAV
jgi:hypothetical protein